MKAYIALGFALSLAAQPVVAQGPGGGFDWTGFYAGVLGGGGQLNTTFGASFSAPGISDYSGYGATFGAEAGANLAFGNALVGVEADVSWTNLDASFNAADYYDHTRAWDRLATLRVRAGIISGNALFFATAGLAAASVRYSLTSTDTCANPGSMSFCYADTQFGFVAGGGAELGITENVSAKLEVLYVGLPTMQINSQQGQSTFIVGSNAVLARAGVNLHF